MILRGFEGAKLFASSVGFSILREMRKLKDAILVTETFAAKDRSRAWMQSYNKEKVNEYDEFPLESGQRVLMANLAVSFRSGR